MKTLFPQLVGSLIVLFALCSLISEERKAPRDSGLSSDSEAASRGGEGLMQALLLGSQRQSESEAASIVEAQQLLKENGFYSGSVDGTMSQRTREALRSFQQSRQLNVTERIDDATAQELGLQTTIP
jgi:peptidoglycan hydrolase-like protein with peptidoglycan-binding domain